MPTKKKSSPISKSRKNYYQDPKVRLAAAKHNDELTPAEYDIENPEFKIILYELDKVKLYLFDFVRQFNDLKEQIIQIKFILDRIRDPGAYTSNPGPLPEFNRNVMYRGPNANKGHDFVRKNVAQILKNMMPRATLDMMPKEVREAYHNILSVMGAPNDPIWEKEHPPDPREPTTTFQNVADLWNNVADNMKKLDNVNLSDEIANAANVAFSEENIKHVGEVLNKHLTKEDADEDKEEDNKDGNQANS
jgi:hypothetical protein